MNAPLPAQIGRFRIEALLGRGAMGVVYKAHDPHIDRAVAIKLIHSDLLHGDRRQNYLARFHNEAKVAGRCVHSNIVTVYDYSVEGESPYLVMEYVEGIDLSRAMRNRLPFDDSAVMHIALQVLDALSYAHSLDVVHRDIKPSNIMLTAQSDVRVADFGISRLISLETTQSAVLGTPSYMAPEQCRGATVDGRSDLFSLGCVIYELLAGERAFAGDNYPEMIYRLVHEPHRPLAELRRDIAPRLAAAVDRALAKSPDERFESAAAMAAALRGVGDDVDVTTVSNNGGLTALALSSMVSGDGTGTTPPAIDDPSLASIERRLAAYLGPMAAYKLRQALAQSRSAIEFCELLSRELPEGDARDSFRRDAMDLLSRSPGAGSRDTEPETPREAAELEILTRALTQVMGPIAPHVVRRAQARGLGPTELEVECAEMIDSPRLRARFSDLLARYRGNIADQPPE
jgi:serine/threonine-protein kinase